MRSRPREKRFNCCTHVGRPNEVQVLSDELPRYCCNLLKGNILCPKPSAGRFVEDNVVYARISGTRAEL